MISVNICNKPLSEPQCGTLLAVGDCYAGENQEFVSSDIVGLIQDSGLSMVNVEGPLTSCTQEITKSGPAIKSSPKTARRLVDYGFDLAVLANNHTMDYGVAGLDDTLHNCEQAGLGTVGAGHNLGKANTGSVFVVNDCRIGVLAFAEREFSIADSSAAGVAELDSINVWRAMREIRDLVDVVVVHVHGGSELSPFPSSRTRELYHFIAEIGADVIIGHHPHVMQGYEIYQGVPIFYSLGNLFFASSSHMSKLTKTGLLVRFGIKNKRISNVEVHFLQVCSKTGRTRFVSGGDECKHSRNFSQLCAILKDDALCASYWTCWCMDQQPYFYPSFVRSSYLTVELSRRYFMHLIRALRFVDLVFWGYQYIQRLCMSVTGKKKLWAKNLNYVQCPSHHDKLCECIQVSNPSRTEHLLQRSNHYKNYKELMAQLVR